MLSYQNFCTNLKKETCDCDKSIADRKKFQSNSKPNPEYPCERSEVHSLKRQDKSKTN